MTDFRTWEKKSLSLQQQFAANSICFGCGPANQLGLRLKSFVLRADQCHQLASQLSNSWLSSSVSTDRLVACFQPSPHHQAFSGVVNGGILGALIDCQMNWTACWNLMRSQELEYLPNCVTATFHVDFLAPTPSDGFLLVIAEIIELSPRKASVRCELGPLNQTGNGMKLISAQGSGVFVAVRQEHPAFDRWSPNGQ